MGGSHTKICLANLILVYTSQLQPLLQLKHKSGFKFLRNNLCKRLVCNTVIIKIYNFCLKYTFPLLFLASKNWCLERQKLHEQWRRYSKPLYVCFCSLLQTLIRSVQSVSELQLLLVACCLFPSVSVVDAVIPVLCVVINNKL
jgi:hypothetical protein